MSCLVVGADNVVNDTVVELFMDYLQALSEGSESKVIKCLHLLNLRSLEHRREKLDPSQLREGGMTSDDMHSLDFLLGKDISQLSFLSLCYLRAIADHHQLPSHGSRLEVEEHVRHFYKRRVPSSEMLSSPESFLPDDDDDVGMCLESD